MSKKILILEDDSFLGNALMQKLNKEGFNVTLVEDGVRGFEQMSTLQPDLILLDIMLPQMSGYDILEKKSKNDTIKDIPVIVISNSGQPVEINRALQLGARDYLVKAEFDPEDVLVKVKKQLKDTSHVRTTSEIDFKADTKVAIVEDDILLSELLQKKLLAEGCIVKHAGDGSEALVMINAEQPNIVLLDLLLPGIDGFEVLTSLKTAESTKQIPVLVLSNLGQEKDLVRGRELGASGYLLKATVTLDEIVDEMKKILAG